MGLEYSYYYRTLLYYILVLLSRGGKRTYAITHNIKYKLQLHVYNNNNLLYTAYIMRLQSKGKIYFSYHSRLI